eukprot:TRINITY_DN7191_c0_g1_i1.p1 TRINITY_DN7191_c0_g1~~TRINITY_DN7191_c0_g1_i1.p1  ORF type:complete len:345 (-),score=81.37 TRINITY_DN7191_c0_g1_i1:122-1156(-)
MFGQKEQKFVRFLLTESWATSWIIITVLTARKPRHGFQYIGMYVTFTTLVRLAKWLHKHFLRRPLPNLREKYGGWALITGASDGIGRALSFEFAKRGFPLILISRTQSKLETVANEIRSRHGNIAIKVVTADFSDPQRGWINTIKEQTSDLEVGVLVNNVGSADSIPTDFLDVSDEFMFQMFELNVFAATIMTRLLMPQMIVRGKGAVVNVGSCSAAHPTPMLALYSSTKAYLKQLTECIHYEYKEKNIDVLHVSPYYVVSSLSGIKKPTLLVPSAERFASDAMRDLGYGESYSNSYWVHAAFEWISQVYSQTPQRLHLTMKRSRERNLARRAATGNQSAGGLA